MTLIQVKKTFENIFTVTEFTQVKSLWRRTQFVPRLRTRESKVDSQEYFNVTFYFLYITKTLVSVDLFPSKIEKHAPLHTEKHEFHLHLSISYAVF